MPLSQKDSEAGTSAINQALCNKRNSSNVNLTIKKDYKSAIVLREDVDLGSYN